jgi:hypothetical protein
MYALVMKRKKQGTHDSCPVNLFYISVIDLIPYLESRTSLLSYYNTAMQEQIVKSVYNFERKVQSSSTSPSSYLPIPPRSAASSAS